MSPRVLSAVQPLFEGSALETSALELETTDLEAREPAAPARELPQSGVVPALGAAEVGRSLHRVFMRELAALSAGIGFVQLVHLLHRRGVLARLRERGPLGASVGELARKSGANLGYLNVALRALAAEQWLERNAHAEPERTRIELSAQGLELLALLEGNEAASKVARFSPVAQNMAAYLFGDFDPPAELPSLARLAQESAQGWGFGKEPSAVARRWQRALDGNLLGPVAVALKDEFYPGLAGRLVGRSPEVWRHRPLAWWLGRQQRAAVFDTQLASGSIDLTRLQGNGVRLRAAFAVLEHAGWLSLEERRARFTPYGAYAAQRAWAFGVPVSYQPLFERLEELLFGDAAALWERPRGTPEWHVDRTLNVKACGASHGRYFAAGDAAVLDAFNRPFAEQPLGFVDMGSGDGAWLEHVWRLISNRSDRGRLIRAFPRSRRYDLLMVAVDYNEAALQAARQRLTRAGVPHLALAGDIDDPLGLRQRLASHGVDSRQLLHGSSFLVHNRPYTGVKDAAAARTRQAAVEGAYCWRGQAVPNRDLEQNLVEFFRAWGEVIGRHGMLAIELHDPERVALGMTLTNYLLTHGLSDQFTVGLEAFRRAAAEAGLILEPHLARSYPSQPELATVSVSHFRRP